ncbi:hypothetical protein BM525_20895 (plasmid) [Alteromonas mediterranea]|uniref:PEP-CTERM sorting domain-containing protein n=1 Tax=Alteromonas mediterranea TaxID=314275 RepID=A0AAC9JGY7_9ALTE|nr:hypothetical protein [Alteromonas mediterranea]APD92321.1 hypothetical protein BM524_20670 [Alteromonas mediterranea]APE00182.1 hypothetical protein BM525_20895 [Alteromonas mediterranea]
MRNSVMNKSSFFTGRNIVISGLSISLLAGVAFQASAGGHFSNGHAYGHCKDDRSSKSKYAKNNKHTCQSKEEEDNKLFSAQVKLETYLPFHQDSGSDIFLRYGDSNYGVADNIPWEEYDNYSHTKLYNATFSWTLTRVDQSVEFQFGDNSLSYFSEDGLWEGVGLYFDTSGDRNWLYDHAWLNLTVDEWNGDLLSNPFSYTSSLGNVDYLTLTHANQKTIDSISGTLTLDWDMNYWSHFYSDSPGDDFSVWIKGIDFGGVDYAINDIALPPLSSIEDSEAVPSPFIGAMSAIFLGVMMTSIGRKKNA